MLKKTVAFLLLALGTSAYAEMADEVRVSGRVGDFDQEKVSLEFESGVMVIIPRDSVVGVRDLRPGTEITAYPPHKKMKLKKRKRSLKRKKKKKRSY